MFQIGETNTADNHYPLERPIPISKKLPLEHKIYRLLTKSKLGVNGLHQESSTVAAERIPQAITNYKYSYWAIDMSFSLGDR